MNTIRFDFKDEKEVKRFLRELDVLNATENGFGYVFSEREGYYSVKIILNEKDVDCFCKKVVSTYKTAVQVDLNEWDF